MCHGSWKYSTTCVMNHNPFVLAEKTIHTLVLISQRMLFPYETQDKWNVQQVCIDD
jgi:hypothetical protein